VILSIFCLVVLMVLLPMAGFLTELTRADTARTVAAIQAHQRGEEPS
jgi:hypothetical protein